MEGNYLKIIFVIDESGSMQGSESDVIGGFNSYIERHKKENAGEVTVSLYKFNSLVTKVITNQLIDKTRSLTLKDYLPNNFTALYDAIGQAIQETDSEITSNLENEKPDKVLVVIITDGQENASKEFSSHAIKTLIATHENLLNWDFIFLGAGLDNFDDANLVGIKNKMAFKKTSIMDSFVKIADSNIKYCKSDKQSKYDIPGLVNELSDEKQEKSKSFFEKLMKRGFN